MDDGKKVSIIVPVYQKEDYIDRTVSSILRQTYPLIEILLIDDGSKDRSLLKCKKWEEKEDNIKVYHHENSGVSYTRNFGIMHATGDYIMFLDSDDTLTECAVERMVYELKQSRADICICGYSRKIGTKTADYIPDVFGTFTKAQFMEKQFKELYQKHILHNIGTKMYRKDILIRNSIRFLEGYTVYEDISFCLEYIKLCKKISILNKTLYVYYCDDTKSVNHNYREDLWENTFELNKSLAEVIMETDLYYTIIMRNIYGAFRNELLASKLNSHIIREKILSVCRSEDVLKSKGRVQLAELTLEERLFTVFLWNKQCWLIYIMLKIKHMKAKGKTI